jgi:3-dehydroquinate synthase
MPPVRIRVQSRQQRYDVIVGSGALDTVQERFAEANLRDPIVVSAAPIWRRHGDRLAALAGPDGPVLIPDGERFKTLATVSRVYEALGKRGATRTHTVVAVGGGVLGDVAGFAAATYLRGLPLVQIPTTLLAQVDSAVGGKVGVNLAGGKNLVGAFHPASLVLCDTGVLATLPRREFRAGLYEVVKYGAIASRALFESVDRDLSVIFDHDAGRLDALVAECCEIKARVVEEDEHERGPRRVLNFGHTVGHAIEAVTAYKRFRHGEAIAYGMRAAAAISVKRGLMPAGDADRLETLLQRMGPVPPVADLSRSELIAAVGRDKKIANGRLHFVLSHGLGETTIADDVTTSELNAALDAIGVAAAP